MVGLGLLLASLGLRLGHVLVGARLLQAQILRVAAAGVALLLGGVVARVDLVLGHGGALRMDRRQRGAQRQGQAQGGVSVVLHDR
ncbi:hypothetical protein WJ968_24750 [Achromobacter xylosoxidans]